VILRSLAASSGKPRHFGLIKRQQSQSMSRADRPRIGVRKGREDVVGRGEIRSRAVGLDSAGQVFQFIA